MGVNALGCGRLVPAWPTRPMVLQQAQAHPLSLLADTLAALRRLTEGGCAAWSHPEPCGGKTCERSVRELYLTITAWMAEMESARRPEWIKAGLARCRRDIEVGRIEGRIGGRNPSAKTRGGTPRRL
jgi:DNA invertase Pin-like site-specific DNA recombinase